jgi:nucleotide-binding universal stress UspA family protein
MKILIYLGSESYNHPPVHMGKIIGQATKADIHLLIVVPKDGHLENGQAVAEQAALDLNGLSPQIFIKQGRSSAIIKEALDQEEYQLVITNADRVNRFRKSAEVDPVLFKQSTISLLLTENAKPKLEKILVCSGCKEDDYSLTTQTVKLAADLNASLTLLHVISGSVPTMYTGLDLIEEKVDEMLQTETPFAKHLRRDVEILKESGVSSAVKIRRGIPIEEIVRETQEYNYDLIVIGSSKVKEGLKEMIMGNMTVKIIDRIVLPVLIIGSRALE